MIENYYTSQKTKLMKDFERASSWYRPHLAERYGQKVADVVKNMARSEYESLIPHIPYIGGAKVHMTSDLLESVLQLAYLRVLRADGRTAEESRDIVLQAMKTRLAQYPRLLLRLLGWWAFSKSSIGQLQRQSRESHKREYPDGFVFDVVIGDGKEFDWGLDFKECGICKFYQAQNAAEFLPLVCPLDYVLSDAFGYGLVRTKTLAEGDDSCNPRMKRGRPTGWRLSSELRTSGTENRVSH